MTYKLYESYGMLAHEKRHVYSDMIPATDAYNVITVNIPDEYPVSVNESGDTLIDIDGNTYLLREVLNNSGDRPALKWFDGYKHHTVTLKTV